MRIRKRTPSNKPGKGWSVEIEHITGGSLDLVTNERVTLTMCCVDNATFITVTKKEFEIMRAWFDKT